MQTGVRWVATLSLVIAILGMVSGAGRSMRAGFRLQSFEIQTFRLFTEGYDSW